MVGKILVVVEVEVDEVAVIALELGGTVVEVFQAVGKAVKAVVVAK